jgi:hypothetical protein
LSNYDGNYPVYEFVGGGMSGGSGGAVHLNNSYSPLAGEQAAASPQSNVNAQRQSFVSSLAGMGIQTGGFRPGQFGPPPSVNHAAADLRVQGNSVRSNFRDYNIFGRDWYSRHPSAWNPRGNAQSVWSGADWADINGWFGLNWPICSYMYGSGLTYENDDVCLDGRPFATADKYYDLAVNIAQAGAQANTSREPQAGNAKWLPLGVFEAIPNAAKSSNMIFQLAVNKAGIIRGNYFDTADKNVQLLEGSVDLDTQRAAWVVADKKSIIFDCPLYNLTRLETTLLVHLGKDKNEPWTFVRLTQQPNGTAK